MLDASRITEGVLLTTCPRGGGESGVTCPGGQGIFDP